MEALQRQLLLMGLEASAAAQLDVAVLLLLAAVAALVGEGVV